MKRERKYYITIFVVVILYLVTSCFFNVDTLSKRVSTVTTLIAAVAFWLQLKRTERLNESNYIMNLNNQFINNKDMTQIEHVLELYYNQYEARYSKYGIKASNSFAVNLELRLDLAREGEDCQKLINYLVYLEALAALVERNVIHIDVIDNLFSYRFFLAVNNPIVQETELIPYKEFYQGIYWLSKEWTKIRKQDRISIPMEEFNLGGVDVESRLNAESILSVEVSQANTTDDKEEIASCIYDTDPFIYPAAFGNDRDEAVKAIAEIIGIKGTLLALDNLILMRYNGHVIGSCLLYQGDTAWPTKEYSNILKDILSDINSFVVVSKEYFEKEITKANDIVHIVSFCVSPGFRERGLSNVFLKRIIESFPQKSFQLEVLSSNNRAIKLYKKHGFTIEGTYDGFNIEPSKRPTCYLMLRQPSD